MAKMVFESEAMAKMVFESEANQKNEITTAVSDRQKHESTARAWP